MRTVNLLRDLHRQLDQAKLVKLGLEVAYKVFKQIDMEFGRRGVL